MTRPELWSELEDIDRRAWVVEPEKPTYAVTYRRLSLGSNSALQIDLDSAAPRAVPECRFFGAETAVASLRDLMNQQLHSWSLSRPVMDNLETVLQIQLPSAEQAAAAVAAAAAEEKGHGAPCAICYTYRLDGAIPERVCDNTHCSRGFHTSCLLEWLRSSADARTSFDTVYGNCPYCSEAIFVKASS